MPKMNRVKTQFKKEAQASFFYVLNPYNASLTEWFCSAHAKVDLSF